MNSKLTAALAIVVIVIIAAAAYIALSDDSDDTDDSKVVAPNDDEKNDDNKDDDNKDDRPRQANATTATTIEQLDAALKNGDDVTLGTDLEFTVGNHIVSKGNWDLTVPAGVESTLDLNGHSLSFVSTWGIKVFGKLTITGQGYVKNSYSVNSVVLGAAGSSDAELIIVDGTYSNEGDSECVLARDGAHVSIYGGDFSSIRPNVAYSNGFLLNLEDYSASTITVYGGTFHGFNPERGDNQVEGSYVADGYVSTDTGDSIYVVSKAS